MASSYTSPSVTASGATWANLKAKGVSGHLNLLIAAQPSTASAAPTAPTLAATGGGTTGGNLAAGTVFVKVTETNGYGETTASTEVNAAVAAGNIPRVTFAALQSGNVARNVYVGMATGAEVLYAQGVTASTYDLSAAIPTDSSAVVPPTTNTTALSAKQRELLAAAKAGNLQMAYNHMATVVDAFLSGRPLNHAATIKHFREAHAVFAAMNTVCSEIGALLVANPGTVGTVATPIGGRESFRTLP